MSRYFEIARAVRELKIGNPVTFDGLKQADGNSMYWVERATYPTNAPKGLESSSDILLCFVSRKNGRLICQPLCLESTEITARKWRMFDCRSERYQEELYAARDAGVLLEKWLSAWFSGGITAASALRKQLQFTTQQ